MPVLDIENIVQVTSPIGPGVVVNVNHHQHHHSSPDNGSGSGSMFTNLNLVGSPVQVGVNGKKVIDPTLVSPSFKFFLVFGLQCLVCVLILYTLVAFA